MMYTTIHDIKQIRARVDSTKDKSCVWMTLTFVDSQGSTDEVTVYFNSLGYATRLVEAINGTTLTLIKEALANAESNT